MSPAPAGISNTLALGRVLYTDYIFLFQTAGLILLVAMIGAIVLTLRDRKTSRHQVIRDQTQRTVAETMEMLTISLGAGTTQSGGFLRPKVTGGAGGGTRGGGGTWRALIMGIRIVTVPARKPATLLPGSSRLPAATGCRGITPAATAISQARGVMMAVGIGHYLVVSAILLVLGIFGIFLNRKNVIIILMSIELILLAVNLNLVAFSPCTTTWRGRCWRCWC